MLELQKMGFILIIVTNQSGIARGFFTEAQFLFLTQWMLRYLKDYGVNINAVYYCPHHIRGLIKKFKKICYCRKPNPGMLICAQQHFRINMDISYMVGNKQEDMLAGKAVNIGTNVLVYNNMDKITKESASLANWLINDLNYLPNIIKNCK